MCASAKSSKDQRPKKTQLHHRIGERNCVITLETALQWPFNANTVVAREGASCKCSLVLSRYQKYNTVTRETHVNKTKMENNKLLLFAAWLYARCIANGY